MFRICLSYSTTEPNTRLTRNSYCCFEHKESKGKEGKDNHAPQESVGSSPSSRPWAGRWRTINVYDAWPVRRQTYSYLPSRQASPPIGLYQIILLGDRGTRVL